MTALNNGSLSLPKLKPDEPAVKHRSSMIKPDVSIKSLSIFSKLFKASFELERKIRALSSSMTDFMVSLWTLGPKNTFSQLMELIRGRRQMLSSKGVSGHPTLRPCDLWSAIKNSFNTDLNWSGRFTDFKLLNKYGHFSAPGSSFNEINSTGIRSVMRSRTEMCGLLWPGFKICSITLFNLSARINARML